MNININIISAQYTCIQSVEMWKRDVRSFDVCANFCASHKWPLGSYNFNNTVPFCSVLCKTVRIDDNFNQTKNKEQTNFTTVCWMFDRFWIESFDNFITSRFQTNVQEILKIDRNEFQRNLLLLLWLSALDRAELLSQHLMHRHSFHHIECTFINYSL